MIGFFVHTITCIVINDLNFFFLDFKIRNGNGIGCTSCDVDAK